MKRTSSGARKMPGEHEKPFTLTMSVRRSTKFLELKHTAEDYHGVLFSSFKGAMTDITRQGMLTLQVLAPSAMRR